MAKAARHRWEFMAHFRRRAFGCESRPAIQRVQQAVAEIRKVARKDPVLAGEGAVLFLERVSSAFARVGRSSGVIGTAVNDAIAELAPIISGAPADARTREAWLERLWEAHANDSIPFIKGLADYWGDLCASKEVASAWADRLLAGLQMEGLVPSFPRNPSADRLIAVLRLDWMLTRTRLSFCQGAPACLSALFRAERYDELLALIKLYTPAFSDHMQWGVRALAAQGRPAEAITLAESMRGQATDKRGLARLCEEILLSSGQVEEAYRHYGIVANEGTTHLATYQALARKYPHLTPAQIIADIVASIPGHEDQGFASARDDELHDVTLHCRSTGPCDPKTLIRAAPDHSESNPDFAINVGLAALRWVAEGRAGGLVGRDVWAAYHKTLKAAEAAGRTDEVKESIREIAMSGGRTNFVAEVLGRELGLPGHR
jgi:hypothetical protein